MTAGSINLLETNIPRHIGRTLLAYRQRLRVITIVSPWLSVDRTDRSSIAAISECVRHSRCSLVVITRPPETEWHREALEVLTATGHCTTYLNPMLHSKLYLMEGDGIAISVLGSPNLTVAAASLNRELALELRSTRDADLVAKFIHSLIDYARSLRLAEGTQVMDKRSNRWRR